MTMLAAKRVTAAGRGQPLAKSQSAAHNGPRWDPVHACPPKCPPARAAASCCCRVRRLCRSAPYGSNILPPAAGTLCLL